MNTRKAQDAPESGRSARSEGASRRSEGGSRRQAGEAGRPRPGGPATVTLTGRGGIAAIFVVELAARLLATVIALGPIPGILFVGACVAAAFTTRRSDQLVLVVSPPIIFFTATLIVEFLKAMGGAATLRVTLTGLLLALASDAPWLFLGTLLTVGIAMTRGLPGSLADLRERLASSAAKPKAAATRHGGRRRVQVDDFDEDPVRWDVSP